MQADVAVARAEPRWQPLSDTLASASAGSPDPVLAVELGAIVGKVGASLGGSVPPHRIEALIRQLLEQEFSDARVTTFLPIFLYRYALEALRAEAAALRAPEV